MLRHLWWVLGLVLVACGVVLGLATQPGPADLGWFAYTPLSADPDWIMGWGDSPLDGSVVIVSWWQLAGAALAATGLLVAATGIGFRLGRRRT